LYNDEQLVVTGDWVANENGMVGVSMLGADVLLAEK
jgi:hypothetical protein